MLNKIYNYFLVKRYPFLVPRNEFNDTINVGYDYSYTELDLIPDGWRKAFGLKMCEEIRKVLVDHNWLYRYRIAEIKEKYGAIRWYDYGSPEEIKDIISKYEEISKKTCIHCGKPATWVSTGWISPWCDKCKEKIRDKVVKIDKFQK